MNCVSAIAFRSRFDLGVIVHRKWPLASEDSHDLNHSMNLSLPTINLEKYKSASQRSRIVLRALLPKFATPTNTFYRSKNERLKSAGGLSMFWRSSVPWAQ